MSEAPDVIFAHKGRSDHVVAGLWLTIDGYKDEARRDGRLGTPYLRVDGLPREMAEALKALRPYAQKMIADICADMQEGGTCAGIEKWNAVLFLCIEWDKLEKGDG